MIGNEVEAAPETSSKATAAEPAPDFPGSSEVRREPGTLGRASLGSVAGILPSRVDIFWCEDSRTAGESRRTIALAVSDYLADNGTINRVRVRPLSDDINRTPSYNIYDNIVRYDPGEADAAKALAEAAQTAAEASFSAAPALPGSPSVDYLSIFVCR